MRQHCGVRGGGITGVCEAFADRDGVNLKRIKDKPIEPKQYNDKYGEDLP